MKKVYRSKITNLQIAPCESSTYTYVCVVTMRLQ